MLEKHFSDVMVLITTSMSRLLGISVLLLVFVALGCFWFYDPYSRRFYGSIMEQVRETVLNLIRIFVDI